ncbi:MAG: hypothetical protein PGN13_01620 [Patulibacter minatonensis]
MPAPTKHPKTPTVRSAVARFLAGTLVAVLVIGAAGYVALRQIALDEARRDTGERVKTVGELVEGAGLADGLLDRDPKAIARLNDVIPRSVVRGSVVRVKIWNSEGEILYSDQASLIGKRFALGDEELEILEHGGSEVELSDLSAPENRLEREPGTKLLEAYTSVSTADGEPVLFEIYQRFSFVTELRDRILGQLLLPLVIALLLIGLIQVPLVRRLVRNLGEVTVERERLARQAVDTSRAERLRIAADLSAGAVDALTPVADRLTALADTAGRSGRSGDVRELRQLASAVDASLRQLRGDLSGIHPPDLAEIGLDGALHQLLAPIAAAGVTTTALDVQPLGNAPAAELAYRIAREAIRNADRHAAARRLSVRIVRDDSAGVARVFVSDDGIGFTAGEREEAEHAGRSGLRIAEDLLKEQGGELVVRSVPHEGTVVEATIPLG